MVTRFVLLAGDPEENLLVGDVGSRDVRYTDMDPHWRAWLADKGIQSEPVAQWFGRTVFRVELPDPVGRYDSVYTSAELFVVDGVELEIFAQAWSSLADDIRTMADATGAEIPSGFTDEGIRGLVPGILDNESHEDVRDD